MGPTKELFLGAGAGALVCSLHYPTLELTTVGIRRV